MKITGRDNRLEHIRYLTEHLEKREESDRQSLILNTQSWLNLFKNQHHHDLFQIWKSSQISNPSTSLPKNLENRPIQTNEDEIIQKFVTYLQNDRNLLDSDLRNNREEVRKICLQINVSGLGDDLVRDFIQTNNSEFAESSEFQRACEDGGFLETIEPDVEFSNVDNEQQKSDLKISDILEEQQKVYEHISQMQVRQTESDTLTASLTQKSRALELENRRLEVRASEAERILAEFRQDRSEREDLLKSAISGGPSESSQTDPRTIQELISKVRKLKTELEEKQRQESQMLKTTQELRASSSKLEAKILKSNTDLLNLKTKSQQKNGILEGQLRNVTKVLDVKVREVRLLVAENTGLRREYYRVKGRIVEPLEILTGNGKPKNKGLYTEIEAVMRRKHALEMKVARLEAEMKQKRREERGVGQGSNLEKRGFEEFKRFEGQGLGVSKLGETLKSGTNEISGGARGIDSNVFDSCNFGIKNMKTDQNLSFESKQNWGRAFGKTQTVDKNKNQNTNSNTNNPISKAIKSGSMFGLTKATSQAMAKADNSNSNTSNQDPNTKSSSIPSIFGGTKGIANTFSFGNPKIPGMSTRPTIKLPEGNVFIAKVVQEIPKVLTGNMLVDT